MADTAVIVPDKQNETFPVTPDQIILQSQITQPETFTSIPLDGKKKKVSRRVLHFSDGILEEYSTDEEEETEKKKAEPPVNPKSLRWLPWFWYYIVRSAKGSLYVADSCGERLSWFFGITSPKYQYAIDEYYKLKQLEEEEKLREEQSVEMVTLKKAELIESGGGGDGGVPGVQIKKF